MSTAQLVPRLLCSVGDVLCHGSRSELFISRKFKLCIGLSDVWGGECRCTRCFWDRGEKFTISRVCGVGVFGVGRGKINLFFFLPEQIVSLWKEVTFKVHGNLIREQRRHILQCIQAVEVQDRWEDHADCAEVALCKGALEEAERAPLGGGAEPSRAGPSRTEPSRAAFICLLSF